ncbi:fused MFS/spermidine synthase [Telmatobacter sp. DSM 110680]|uniref:Fused MFS/spermidine synthase n=1 Tax=Telmatobacter sp. DSM 110680 TaxID=3036704 RepID=A0AAU7DRA6_9BACT
MILVLFSISVFLSAALLFLVEPMVAKMLLPLLGGSPAVWNTCLVFFQAFLLAGYAYAHAATKWFKWRVVLTIQCALLLLPALIGVLPLHLPHGSAPPTQANPIPWILSALAVSVGIPFFALSSCTPMLQRWFATSRSNQAKDPYFLYAASNAGSIVGLLAYPFLLEPMLTLGSQGRLWSIGYVTLTAAGLTCAVTCWNPPTPIPGEQHEDAEQKHEISMRTRFRWIALAFVPSSLMLGVTTAITTDVPAIPLFWMIPLALYLLSFVFVFARRQFISPTIFDQRLPILILCGLVPGMLQSKLPLLAMLILYSILLFSVAMVCHGELAATRPPAYKLTEFYLLISVGGVLGGVFNSIIAPIAFHSVVEFPIALICAALLRRPLHQSSLDTSEETRARRLDWLLPLALGIGMTAAFLIPRAGGMHLPVAAYFLIFGVAMACCLFFAQRRPIRFGLGAAAAFLASQFYVGPYGHILDMERSFFGVYRVADDPTGRFRDLLHGATLHGMQSLDPAKSRIPLAYYTAGGPAGQIARALYDNSSDDWAIVGLGAGAMACLAQPGQNLTYYEIDPLVAHIAANPRYFTFLRDCAPHATIVMGDARLKLTQARNGQYRMIALDAFSGDSIPMHLVTREALRLYLSKLAPGGLIAFHITNQHLDLAPVLANLAQDASLIAWIEDDSTLTEQQASEGKLGSRWVVMARSTDDLAHLVASADSLASWVPLETRSDARLWTDDYSNLLTVIRWK